MSKCLTRQISAAGSCRLKVLFSSARFVHEVEFPFFGENVFFEKRSIE